MYTPLVRLALIAAFLLLGTLGLRGGFPWPWLWFTAAVLCAIGYWRGGTVWLAWRAFRNGDLALVERRLAQIRSPNRLSPRQRAYYEWAQGEVQRARGAIAAARRHFTAAAQGALRTANDRALAYSRLAEAALTAGDLAVAQGAIANARTLAPSPFVEAVLRDLEESIAAGTPPLDTRQA